MTATSLETKQRPWWMTLIVGITAICVGAIMLWAPAKTRVDTYQLLVALLGIYWLVSGIMHLVGMFMDHTAWAWKLFIGIVSIIAGGAILAYPIASAVMLPRVFVLVLAIWAIMEGIILLVLAFKGGGWGAGILGILGIVLGAILLGDYGQIGSGLAMIWAASVCALIGGVILVFQAFRNRSETHQ